MNGKKAKKLRRQAEAETIGKPRVCYINEYHEKEVKVAKSGKKKTIVSTQVLLGDCTRKRYKELKRQYA